MPQPVLETARLRLRPFTDGDAGRVRLLAGDAAVARGSILIPHPYPPGLAERWIATHASQWQQGHGVYYAITQQSCGILIGSISLHLEERRQASGAICHTGTMGYWLGQPYWGAGLMTEAAQAGIDAALAAFAAGAPVRRASGGYGFGLAISRQIMRRMGGDYCLQRDGALLTARLSVPELTTDGCCVPVAGTGDNPAGHP